MVAGSNPAHDLNSIKLNLFIVNRNDIESITSTTQIRINIQTKSIKINTVHAANKLIQ